MAEDLKIFVSWSGRASLTIAQSLSKLLKMGSDHFETFTSSEDIRSGQRWLTVISEQLAISRAGLIIVTPDNQSKPWLNFESGAIANAVHIPNARVIPILCGIDMSSVDPGSPLRQFQMRELTEDGLETVMSDLAMMAGVSAQTVLERARPHLRKLIRDAEELVEGGDDPYVPLAPMAVMLEEVLVIARALSNSASDQDFDILDKSPPALEHALKVLLNKYGVKGSVYSRKVSHGGAVIVLHSEPLSRTVMNELHDLAYFHRNIPIYLERRIEPLKPASIDTYDPEHMKY